MRVAFDLDDTLMPTSNSFGCGEERGGFPFGWIFKESLRKGAKELLREITQSHELWIYTTSLRSPIYIRLWLLGFNINVSGIINSDSHFKAVKGTSFQNYSKSPKLFDIDYMVDDSKGVELECKEQGVNCIVVVPGDKDWVEKVRNGISL